jgi:FixJ family two-component response regulator
MPKPSIVVVDDDPGMNQAIRRLLDAAGFNAVTFGSAEALLAGDAASRAACMIFDIHLPGLSGFDLRRKLQERGVNAPVIFITAYDDAAARTQAEESGAIALFSKPFQREPLLSAIDKALKARGSD